MILPILLLLLLELRASPVFVTEVSVLEGNSVTLVCGSSVKDHGYDTCWARNCDKGLFGYYCSNPIVKMEGGIITINYPKMHNLSGEDLTISNLQDSRSYCCCVDSSIVPYNDHVTYYRLKVVKGCERNLMKGVDFGGNKVNKTLFITEDASQCSQKCTEDDNCQYFTFVRKEANIVQPNRDVCFLKASTGDMPFTIQYLQHATSGYSLRNCSGKVTYSAKKYSLVPEKKNWTEAQEYCRQRFTNLSIIHTEEDWKAIKSTLGNFSGDVWIGLHREKPDPNEKWTWSDGEDFMFFNWATGFGNHMGHNCVISTSSHWQQENCGSQMQYVCQQLVRHDNGATEKVYKLITKPKNQMEAVKDCNHQQRELASICNQKEQDAFDEVTKGVTWIGLMYENNTWHWSSGEPFQKWDNPMCLGDGNCVKLNSENDRKWTQENCSTKSPFLCYGDERPLNTTGDLSTPATPETTSPTSTGPPSSKTSTTPTTTTNGQSTTSPPTTTNGQSPTSPPTTTNGQSTTSPPTTTNRQSTTSPPTTTNGQFTTSPPTSTSSGQLTSSGPTSPDRKPTSSPSSTTSPLHPDYLHYFNESKSWINALEFCKSRGSTSNLVHITNQTVQADVTQLLANVELPCGGVWIGLERSIFEWTAPWLWTSSAVDKVVEHRQWHSCFPLNPINYHCGKMVRVGNGELKWLDASCHQELPFICEDLH